MITRGHYIGEILDELVSISEQIKLRNALGLTDLTVYAENFFKDVVNLIESSKLVNLNQERSNEPGLDLGDTKKRFAVQVTSTASASKVNDTLKKITAAHAASYDKFFVLIIGKKQGSYSIDEVLGKKYSFTVANIWDLEDLARKTISLDPGPLQELHKLIRTGTLKLKVELEIPDESGKFETNSYDKWEVPAKPKYGDGKAFAEYHRTVLGVEIDDGETDEFAEAIKQLSLRLSRLPRVTREFLAVLCERRELESKSKRFPDHTAHLLLAKVEREYGDSDLKSELDILQHAGFIDIDYEDASSGPPEIGVKMSLDSEALTCDILKFIKKNDLKVREVIGQADLSAF